ncbi:MAG: flagellar type III secretion system protein FliR [Beijerinckiaceae bacterium]|nr:flagellar type III secretion system protein FliR [Beijerinckiaceae bacterium]
MTIRLLPEFAIVVMLVFARVGTLMMLMPGIGERTIVMRTRLALGFLTTLVIVPLVRPMVTASPTDIPLLINLLFAELIIGGMIGISARLALSALQTAGIIVANQMSLSYAQTLDPTSPGQQGTVFANFMTMLGVTMIFELDLHHMALAAIFDSYKMFLPGNLPVAADALTLVTDVIVGSFKVGVQISAPFLVFGLVFNAGLGILARMMPQLQVFNIAQPAAILLGTLIFIAIMGTMMSTFLRYMETVLAQFIVR